MICSYVLTLYDTTSGKLTETVHGLLDYQASLPSSEPRDSNMLLELLRQADFSKGTTQCFAVFGSFCIFTAVYLTSMVVSAPFTTYRILSTREKVFWNLIIVRAVFGAYSSLTSAYCLLVEDELSNDIALATTRLSHVIVCSGVGFFMFECVTFFMSAALFGKVGIHRTVESAFPSPCVGVPTGNELLGYRE